MFCSASDPVALEQAACLLRQGGLIAFPTETYYGLGVDPFNVKALERLFQVKQRQPNKPVLVLVAGQAQVAELVAEVPAILARLMTTFWPGPLTLVFPGRALLPFCSPVVPAILVSATLLIPLLLASSQPLVAQLPLPVPIARVCLLQPLLLQSKRVWVLKLT